MSTITTCYNLVTNYKSQDAFTQSFHDYSNLISRSFKPLPSHGKLYELAKRLGIIAAPLIYLLLKIGVLISQNYHALTRWYVRNLLEKATTKISNITELNHGPGPYELVILLSIKSGKSILYADLITLQSNQSANGKLPFLLEKLHEKKRDAQENLKDARFNIGQNIQVNWEGFLKNGQGFLSKIRSNCSCSFMLISPHGSEGFGGGDFDTVEQVNSAYHKRLQALGACHPVGLQHFAC